MTQRSRIDAEYVERTFNDLDGKCDAQRGSPRHDRAGRAGFSAQVAPNPAAGAVPIPGDALDQRTLVCSLPTCSA